MQIRVFAWALLSLSVLCLAIIFSMQRMGWPSIGFGGVLFLGGLLGLAAIFAWLGALIISARLYRQGEQKIGALMVGAGALFCVFLYAAVVDTLCQKGFFSVCAIVP